MKLLERIKKAGAMVFNGSAFESANYSERRSRVAGSSPTDFKHEYQGWTRLETVKKSRYLMKNSGLFREQRDLNVLYAIGADGLMPYPNVDSREWLIDAVEYFKQWSLQADITNRFSFVDVQRLCSKAMDTDGEIFITKVRDRASGECKLQLIETHRVGNFNLPRNESGYIDGFKVDSVGKPTHIRVLQDSGDGRNIRMGHVMHLFDAESPSAYRHVPFATHGLLHGLDEVELLAIEKHAVKDNHGIVRVLKTDQGRLEEDSDFSAGGLVDADGVSDPAKIANITGGKTVAIYPHEDLKEYESNRPSPTFTGFLDHLRRDTCLGMNPYEFAVDPSDASGPAIRMIMAKAQRRFKLRTDIISNKLVRPTWFYVIGTAIDNGDLPPIKGWSNVSITPPRDITVDAGRESEANRRDVASGLKLPSTSYEEQGEDFLASMEKRGDLINAVKEIAKIKGCDPEELFDFTVTAGGKPKPSASGGAPSGGK